MKISKLTDFAHTGPRTLAGQYLRRFWQPVYLAESLPSGRAVPIQIMNETFTLYRGESGTPHISGFRCPHRGTQLSTGWVEDDTIRCFYHGWRYDAAGRCVEQPVEPEPFCDKVHIPTYPAQEYLGLIFGYFGPGEPPPLPRYPQFEGPGFTYARGATWPCDFFQAVENYVDHSHVAFVHQESAFTEGGLRDVPRVAVTKTEYGIRVEGTRSQGEVRVNHFRMPNINQIKVPPEESGMGWQDLLSWSVPSDDDSHHRFLVSLVHKTGQEAEEMKERLRAGQATQRVNVVGLAQEVLAGKRWRQDVELLGNNRILFQDVVAQVGQGSIADREAERLGRGDVGVILLRQVWAQEVRALHEGRPLTEGSKPCDRASRRRRCPMPSTGPSSRRASSPWPRAGKVSAWNRSRAPVMSHAVVCQS